MRRKTQIWLRAITCVLLVIAAWTSQSRAQSEEAKEMFAAGEELVQSEQYDKAVEQFKKCVEADKEFGLAWFMLGYSLHMDGRVEEAIAAHKRAMEFDGEQFQNIARYNLACAFALTGKLKEAMTTLNETVEAGFRDTEKIFTDPDLYSLHPTTDFAVLIAKLNDDEKLVEKLGEAQTALEEEAYGKAVEIYRSIVEVDAKNEYATYRLGYALHAAGKLDEAISYHKKASEFPGTKAIGLYNWGCALSLKGEKDAAIEKLAAAVENGFRRFDLFENDTDLNNVREEAAFRKLADKLQQHHALHGGEEAPHEHEQAHEHEQLVQPTFPYSLGIRMTISDDEGVVIKEVITGTAAERDGLKAGDQLIKIGGKEVGTDPLAALKPFLESGDKIEFEIVREGESMKVTVKPIRRE